MYINANVTLLLHDVTMNISIFSAYSWWPSAINCTLDHSHMVHWQVYNRVKLFSF